MTDNETQGLEVKFPDFARRVDQAIQQHPRIPDGHGKLAYIQREIKRMFDKDVSREVVRRWVNGLVEPRPEARVELAQVLGVTADWLINGKGETAAPSITENAAANIIAGAMQMAGWKVKMEMSPDGDMKAQFRGRTYLIEVKKLTLDEHGAGRIKLPKNVEGKVVLAVAPKGPLAFDIFEVAGESGQVVEIRVSGDQIQHSEGASVARIETFEKPL